MCSVSPDGSCCKLWRREKATPQEIAQLAKGLLRKKIAELEPALEGRLEEHHRFLLELQLRPLQAVEDLAVLERRIQEKLKPYAAQLALLQGIPGGRPLAEALSSGNEQVRAWGLRATKRLPDPNGTELALDLKDQDPAVREKAADLLVPIKRESDLGQNILNQGAAASAS